jgi:hypothetical protein
MGAVYFFLGFLSGSFSLLSAIRAEVGGGRKEGRREGEKKREREHLSRTVFGMKNRAERSRRMRHEEKEKEEEEGPEITKKKKVSLFLALDSTCTAAGFAIQGRAGRGTWHVLCLLNALFFPHCFSHCTLFWVREQVTKLVPVVFTEVDSQTGLFFFCLFPSACLREQSVSRRESACGNAICPGKLHFCCAPSCPLLCFWVSYLFISFVFSLLCTFLLDSFRVHKCAYALTYWHAHIRSQHAQHPRLIHLHAYISAHAQGLFYMHTDKTDPMYSHAHTHICSQHAQHPCPPAIGQTTLSHELEPPS